MLSDGRMRRRDDRAALFALVWIAALACGGPDLPLPAFVGQPTSALVEVPYPPPPARVETIPPRPSARGAVWVDGEWMWRTRRWAWKPGRWVIPPPGARFAPWTTVRDRRGTLYFAPGGWRDPSGTFVPEPPPIAPSGPLPAAVVTPEGEKVRQGPVLPLDGGTPDGEAPEAGSEASTGASTELR